MIRRACEERRTFFLHYEKDAMFLSIYGIPVTKRFKRGTMPKGDRSRSAMQQRCS